MKIFTVNINGRTWRIVCNGEVMASFQKYICCYGDQTIRINARLSRSDQLKALMDAIGRAWAYDIIEDHRPESSSDETWFTMLDAMLPDIPNEGGDA